YLAGPDGLDLLYPRLVTSGEFNETIHIIATTRTTTPYQGLAGAIVYSRSFDGGQTWDPQNLVLEGVDATRFPGFRADCYTMAQPVGETLAFVAGDGYGDVAVMKSIDNGDNWDRIEYYVSIDPFMDGFIEYPRHGALDSYHSIVIDDMGKVHVSSGRQLHRADGLGSRTYYPYSNGLLYWNEDMEPLDTTKIGDNISDPSAVPSQYLLAELVDNGTDTIIGLSTYYSSITSMPQLVFDHEKKILYAIYTSITLGFATELTNFRHVWLRMSDDYGQTWSPPQDLTGDIFHLFSECVYPSASPTVNEKVHFIYQTDNAPGINSRTAEHTVTDNNMVYLTINTIVGINEKPATVVSIDQISPNPANDVANLIVNVDKAVVAEISILNMLGQEVYQSTNAFGYAGPHPFKLDVSNYESGIYFVRVKAGNSSSVKKLIVN
ncbi:MAG: T9SS type A sorting domain-containing protein, partial [Ignavibacteria bacterium]|nr:T9SS type A sorting domain-containing protein [Ignavibacteria bacterium]